MKTKILGLFSASSLVLMMASGSAFAAFDSDLTVTGDVKLSTTIGQSPFSDGAVTQNGSIRTKAGGSTTSSAFTTSQGTADGTDDGTTSPAPSLSGTLTDIGDGIGWSTDLDADFETGFNFSDGYDFVVDFLLNLANTSFTDTLTVTIKANYNNVVNADGVDAFADAKLDLELDDLDVLNGASEVLSDTIIAPGDVKNGVNLLTFGAEVSDVRMLSFDVILLPNSTAKIDGTHQWEGGVFEAGLSDVDISVDITVDNVACSGECIVAPVPVPGAVWLFGTGLSGLAFLGFRRRRTTRRAA